MDNSLADWDRIIRRSAAQARGSEEVKLDERPLQSTPLGRPPMFRQPTTMPPFTAELKLKSAVEKLARRRKVSRSEIMRQAMKLGLAAMIAEEKGKEVLVK
jgi:hypothetical protein